MKSNSINLKFALVFGAAMVFTIFITRPVFSQESASKEPNKKIILKIVSDDNGKTTVIDTIMEMPDTGMIDSIKQEIDKVIELGHGGKHARLKMHCMPQGFNYNFEMPDLPDCPMDMKALEEMDGEGMTFGRDLEDPIWESMAPGPGRMIMRSGGHGQTLSDILGDIPMDRVISYSIKDRKNGKRITIDLNDAPTFQHPDRVIVIREPRKAQRNRNGQERQVKVYVNTDEGGDTESATPPPPPPPAKSKKTTPK